MALLACLVIGALALFAVYCVVVLRYRGRKEREKEREQGLDPLR